MMMTVEPSIERTQPIFPWRFRCSSRK